MANSNSAVTAQLGTTRVVTTAIVGKFQVTVPQEIRDLFGLQLGDVFEWKFDAAKGHIALTPMRAQLLTPVLEKRMDHLLEETRRARVPC